MISTKVVLLSRPIWLVIAKSPKTAWAILNRQSTGPDKKANGLSKSSCEWAANFIRSIAPSERGWKMIVSSIEGDMRVAAVGGEDNGAEDIALVLDGKNTRGGIIIFIVQTAEAHCNRARIGIPIGQQRAPLVPEVSDVG